MQCHLIGVNHAHQLKGYKPGAFGIFQTYLKEFCSATEIDLLAEELNVEAIALWHAEGSVAQSVAEELTVNHLFCDPLLNERQLLGIPSRKEIAARLGYGRVLTTGQDATVTGDERKYWDIRENYWLERLPL